MSQESEERWVFETAYARRAATAVAYALHVRQNGEVQDAVWAALCVYEALDLFVIEQEDIDLKQAGGPYGSQTVLPLGMRGAERTGDERAAGGRPAAHGPGDDA